MPSGSTTGFMNIVTWADSKRSLRKKLERYLGSFRWHLIDIEEAVPIASDEQYGADLEEMIERTRRNPDAIILGTFHGYPTQ